MRARLVGLLIQLLPLAPAAIRTRRASAKYGPTSRPESTKARVDVVVKLGGSALTHKGSFEQLNDHVLNETVEQLAQSGLEGRGVLVHGAGSFGHFRKPRDAACHSFYHC